MSYRSPLGRARGLGSAKSGSEHWMMQRLTAVALVPLILWMVWSLLCMAGAPHAEVVAWVGQPLVATTLIGLIAAMFYHAQLGAQVVIEDYVHHEGRKVAALVGIKLLAAAAALASIVSVLLIALR
nr:succinate dehydrogenase, hydrophobic membrane anchor protein [Oceanococcus sp. HetDA_MAG_MS8]